MKTFAHFLRFMLGLDEPRSQVTSAELAMLIKYARGMAVAVELGCYEGKTAVALAKVLSGQMYSIDPFFKGRLGVNYGPLMVKTHARRNRVNNLELIQKMSWETAKDFHHSVDFLFVDAGHTYEAVRQDWLDWSPKIRLGGFVALHDSKKSANSPYELGSMQFYRQDIPTFKNFVEVDTIDSLVVLRKDS